MRLSSPAATRARLLPSPDGRPGGVSRWTAAEWHGRSNTVDPVPSRPAHPGRVPGPRLDGGCTDAATTPTVSSIAVTSNPGTDGAYDTLDVITVTVTFSEAVAVTGTPLISLDIGGRKREADYAGAGAGTGELLFN